MACARGRPSHAFGPAFAHFDGAIKVPRLPRDPYHFMSRVVHVEQTGSAGGSVAETEYDVPSDAGTVSMNRWSWASQAGCSKPPASANAITADELA